MQLLQFHTNRELVDLAQATGHSVRVIATTLGGREIVCLRAGGDEKPPILITAGAHAEEVAGVHAALLLATSIDSRYTVYIVPNRDPLGLEGFERCLGFALGEEVHLYDHADVESILLSRGDVLHHQDDFIVALVGGIAFATRRTAVELYSGGPVSILRALRPLLKSRPIWLDALKGKRVILPANLPLSEGSRLFNKAYSLYVTQEGTPCQFNRMFDHPERPLEVDCIQRLADEVQPALTLDLHEGRGSKFYLFLQSPADAQALRLAKAMTRAVIDRGYPVSDLEELRRMSFMTPEEYSRHPPESYGDGVISLLATSPDVGKSFGIYAARYGTALATETGMHNALETRVQFILWSVEAAIEVFHELHA